MKECSTYYKKIKCLPVLSYLKLISYKEDLNCLQYEVDKHIHPILHKQKPFNYLEAIDQEVIERIIFNVQSSDVIGKEAQYYALLKAACFYNYFLCKSMTAPHTIPSDVKQAVDSKLESIINTWDFAMLSRMPPFGISLFECETKQIDYCYFGTKEISASTPGPLQTTNLLQYCQNYCHAPNESILIFAFAMKSWESVTNIRFNQVSFDDPACRVYLAEVTSDTFPGTTVFLSHLTEDRHEAQLVLLSTAYKIHWPWISAHEIGHVLGLDHTTNSHGEKSNYHEILFPSINDHQGYSIMSYYSPSGMGKTAFKSTPSIKDISIVQWLYGKPNIVGKPQSNCISLPNSYKDSAKSLDKIEFEIYLFALGIILGCLHQPFGLVASELSRLIENEQCSKNDKYSLTTTLLQMYSRAYMPISTMIGYDMTSRVIINYQSTKYALQVVNSNQKKINTNGLSKIKTSAMIETKALASSLKGLIEISALYLTSPLVYVVTDSIKSIYSIFTNIDKETNPSAPSYKKWARCAFFAFDKLTDSFCNFIPGGKMIMNSLEEQEQAVIKWSRNK